MSRVDRDALFTPVETAEKIVGFLLEQYPGWRELEWFEPSAGEGSFIDAARSFGISVSGSDLVSLRSDIVEADFLSFDNHDLFSEELDLSGKIVFGNPPYGHKMQLAVKFINQAFKLGAEKVAFLLFGGAMSPAYVLNNISGHVELVKIVDTDFINNDTGKNENLNFQPVLMVFDKAPLKMDLNYFDDYPFCKKVTHHQVPVDSDWLIGSNFFYKISDTVLNIEDFKNYKESSKRYTRYYYSGIKIFEGKVFEILRFYDANIPVDNKDFIILLQRLSGFGRRPGSRFINFWLYNKDLIDSTPL